MLGRSFAGDFKVGVIRSNVGGRGFFIISTGPNHLSIFGDAKARVLALFDLPVNFV